MSTFSISKIGVSRHLTIGQLLLIVFAFGLLIASLSIYLMFASYRVSAVRDMARTDGQHISKLVFEHLYSVMRKGVSRTELDELLSHIRNDLPDYSVTVVRGEPVSRQFGLRQEQADQITNDPALRKALQSGREQVLETAGTLRYLYPIRATAECQACHTQAGEGEINGVVDVRVPLSMLEAPITAFAQPLVYLILALQAAFFFVIYMILRGWVSQPIRRLAKFVSSMTRAADYSHRIVVGRVWPLEVKTLAVNFNILMRKIRLSHQELEKLSLCDALTGTYNRRYFDVVLVNAIERAADGGIALMMIDLDDFKSINDVHGHAAGDALLVSVGETLKAVVRNTDTVARLGGDEFAVLAFVRDSAEADQSVERIRQAIESCRFVAVDGTTIHGACSIGCVVYDRESHRNEAVLFQAADEAMYRDKKLRKQAHTTV